MGFFSNSKDYTWLIYTNTVVVCLQVKSFFDKVDHGSGDRAVQQSLESITANIRWIKNPRRTVLDWIEEFLKNKSGSNAKPRPCIENMSRFGRYGRP